MRLQTDSNFLLFVLFIYDQQCTIYKRNLVKLNIHSVQFIKYLGNQGTNGVQYIVHLYLKG